MSCGVGHRQGLDLVLMWMWHRLAAVAPIQPLAWERPCAMCAALKRQKKNYIPIRYTNKVINADDEYNVFYSSKEI